MSALVRRGVAVPATWSRVCRGIQKALCEPVYISKFQYVSTGPSVRTFQSWMPFMVDGFQSTTDLDIRCPYTPSRPWNAQYRSYSAESSQPATPSEELDSADTIKNIYFALQQNFVQKHVSALLKRMDNGKAFNDSVETNLFINMIHQLDVHYSKANDEQKENFGKCEKTQQDLTAISDGLCESMGKIPLEGLTQLLYPLENFKEMSEVMESAAKSELDMRMEKVSMKDVFAVLKTLVQTLPDVKNNELYQQLVTIVNRLITELTFSKDMVNAMYLVYGNEYMKGVDVQSLESKLAEGAQFMDAKQLYQILYLSAKRKKRSSLVRTCSHYLLEKEWKFTELELSNLFYVCSSLHLNHVQFASQLSEKLCAVLQSTGINHVISLRIIKSCSLSNWNDPELLGHLVKEVIKGKEHLSDQNLALLPLSLGTLRVKDVDHDVLLAIATDLTSLKSSSPQLWLKFVWAMCLMQKASGDLVKSVISSNFSEPLLQAILSEPLYRQVATHTMLLNIWAYHSIEQGGELDSMFTQTLEAARSVNMVMGTRAIGGAAADQMTPSIHPSAVMIQVQEALSKIAVSDKSINKSITNKFGYKADFELFVSKSGLPVPLVEKASNKQVLIKVVSFKDMLFGRNNPQEPTGKVAMAIRHLKTPHNAVISIMYNDWEARATQAEKVKYLEELLKKAVQ